VETAATPEVKGQKLDALMDWALLDHYYEGHLGRVLGADPIPMPAWWGRYSPLGAPAAPAAPVSPSIPAGPGGALPTLPGADFAASIANGVQNFSAQVVGDVERFTRHITDQTNPAPASTGSGGYHGGGGHCACACACAGCACACAGGGR
jgi:hypothetical protein